jgi:hypothetical protein
MVKNKTFFTFDGPVYDIPPPDYLLPFERSFDTQATIDWFQANWDKSFHISGIYLITLYTLYKYMEHRKPFELKTPLILWNWMLAFLSTLAVVRGANFWLTLIKNYDIYTSICSKR